jgi:hypothetical protein
MEIGIKHMNVLVACEYSGTVRDAFEDAGWNGAWSCELLPTESCRTKESGKHIQCDCLEVIKYSLSNIKPNPLIDENNNKFWIPKFDLLIAHPTCTFLSYAGTASWNNPGRLRERLKALAFFADLWEAPIPHICLENPRSCASPVIAKYSQQIHPYHFGDPYLKTTWLWLKNLPKLVYGEENTIFERKTAVKPEGYWVNSSSDHKIKRFVPGKETRGVRSPKERAGSFPGIARAMAQQWTEYITNLNKKI